MNASSQPHPVALPALSPDFVQLWLEKTQDLVLLLDDFDRIAHVFQDGSFQSEDTLHWMGLPLEVVLSIESRVKIPMLLGNDAARPHSDARWRHINLTGLRGNNVPVLAQYMRLPGEQPFNRAIFCRDLRSVEAMSHRLLTAQRELERSHQALKQDLLQRERRFGGVGPAVTVQGVVEAIKSTTYERAIQETVTHLERQCLEALLAEAQGDAEVAAATAGLSLQEWLNKRATLGAMKT